MWSFISDKRNYKCAACEHEFRYRESVCEDWNDPRRSFLCPSCGVYLDVPEANRAARIISLVWVPIALGIGLSIYLSNPAPLLICGLLFGCVLIFANQKEDSGVIRTEVIDMDAQS